MANYLLLSDAARGKRLQSNSVLQQVRVEVDQVANNDLEVIKDTFNRLEVREIGRQPLKRDAVVLEKAVTCGVMNGRVVKQQNTRRGLQGPGNACGEPPHLLDDTAEE